MMTEMQHKLVARDAAMMNGFLKRIKQQMAAEVARFQNLRRKDETGTLKDRVRQVKTDQGTL